MNARKRDGFISLLVIAVILAALTLQGPADACHPEGPFKWTNTLPVPTVICNDPVNAPECYNPKTVLVNPCLDAPIVSSCYRDLENGPKTHCKDNCWKVHKSSTPCVCQPTGGCPVEFWDFVRCECSGGGGGPGECDFDGGASCGFGGEDPLCYCETPIIVSYRGNGLQLTDTFFGVNFDLNADGIAERLAWTTGQADDAFLTLDRNANGVVDDGTELFGNRTDQPASSNPNGFRALATFDAPENGGNADGIINADDAVFAHLKLWADSNHDGVSQPAELRPASQTIIAFDLAYRESRRTDQYGNQFRYISQVQMNREISGPSRKFAVDVVLGTER